VCDAASKGGLANAMRLWCVSNAVEVVEWDIYCGLPLYSVACRCTAVQYAVVGFLVYNRPIGEVWLSYSNLVLVEAERIEPPHTLE
jgi:hypothetical protein